MSGCARAAARTAAIQAIALVLLAAIPAIGAGFFHPKRPSWQSDEITQAKLKAWDSSALVIDARPAADFHRGHIPGALPLNEDAWNDLLPEVLAAWEPDKKVVVYCSSLSCQTSREVAARLRAEVGLPAVFVLRGGWEEWRKAHP